ncbi:hypothetical protein JG688_00010767 [Phytophthora aleatoria]|uniref:Uncharacterized protein n=1 Tax=Phytophthora aleatoria TaxID=2496075 RepID=A0A8J5J4N6_9STRA|nr:hypothetical protein JG688_00010767 [Phytophthora aleatoria]
MAPEQALLSGHITKETATEAEARRTIGRRRARAGILAGCFSTRHCSCCGWYAVAQVMQDVQVICYSTFSDNSTCFIACYW